MPVRIESTGGDWVEFRDTKWTFGDRKTILDSTDWDALEIILPYVTGWSVKDVEGAPVELPATRERLLLVDDTVVSWLIRSWFEARAKRIEVPKVL